MPIVGVERGTLIGAGSSVRITDGFHATKIVGRLRQRSAMLQARQDALRKLPAVDALLQEPTLQELMQRLGRRIVVEGVRQGLAQAREDLREETGEAPTEEGLRQRVLAEARRRIKGMAGPHYRKVINATGVILHTALGRAVLPRRALRQMEQELAGYSLLQMDLASGERSRRDERIEWLAGQLTGAEAATVVNNNAAATAIVLNTVAAGKEVIVSRGQLVEIGGSFRLPEVMTACGTRLVEVGTTNRTHPQDYERAITANTAALMRVHPSNYRIRGFTAEVPLGELGRMAQAHGLVLIDDAGAGALVDLARWGFGDEPTLAQSIRAGADVVTCSTDKLIGGPQGGLILGKKALIAAIRKNPLARIVRMDKLRLAALEATLALFLDEDLALAEVPTLAMLRRSGADLAEQANRVAAALKEKGVAAEVNAVDGASQMGSGSLPTEDLPTKLVAVRPGRMSVDDLAQRLRLGQPPIITRIQDDGVMIDPRTLQEGEEAMVIEALAVLLGRG